MAQNSPYEREVILPSRGLLYGSRLPEGRITIRAMTVKEERLLVGNEAGDQIFNRVLTRLVQFPPSADKMTPLDLTIEDRVFCFVQIRAISFSSLYEFTYTCGSCKQQVTGRTDLNELESMLPTEAWNQDPDGAPKDAPEPFHLQLPNGDQIGWRFLRGSDEEAITRFGRTMAKKARLEGDPEYTYRLAKHIVEINDKRLDDNSLTFVAVRDYVEGMYSQDVAELRNHMEANRAGLDMLYEDRCPLCGEHNELGLPFDARSFFRIHQRRGQLPD